MKTMNKIEELKNKIAEAKSNFNKASKEVEYYRELSVRYNEELQEEFLKESVEKYSFLLGKYWKCSKAEKNRECNLFIFVNDIFIDKDYSDATCFKCESVEYCYNIENGQLLWYSYLKSCDYFSDTNYEIGCSFNPNSLIEITEDEFLSNKKV